MTASSNISIAAAAPSYASNSISIDRAVCGGGLTVGSHWDGRTYVGDFPPVTPDQIGHRLIHQSPIWIEPNHPYPYTKPVDTVESFRKALESFVPPTKFRATESGDRILLSLDIPGVRRGGVELTIEGYVVTVKAHRADLKQKIEESYTLTQEYDVDPREIDAWHEDGVLTVAFKRMGNGPVKIDVR